jgi:glycosyltransferase involved in cell wall biosynthesis
MKPPAFRMQAVFLFICSGQGEKKMEPISVVIITFNEEQNIRNCLLSVQGIASETLVLDSGSTDNTVRIAKALGARVETHPFDGHIQQKNRAKDMATHDWVLSLDADERLSPTLTESIAKIMEEPTADGYTMNRLNHY